QLSRHKEAARSVGPGRPAWRYVPRADAYAPSSTSPLAWSYLAFLAIKLKRSSFQLSLHDQSDTETHLSRANYFESTGDIESFSVRISHHMQRFGSMCFCC